MMAAVPVTPITTGELSTGSKERPPASGLVGDLIDFAAVMDAAEALAFARTVGRVLPLHLRGASGLGRLPRRHDQTAPLLDPGLADESRSERHRLTVLSIGRVEKSRFPT
jgi:hypothetical protein